ncbi:putative binuclear zinc transcription factor [Triangularia verruculosa]|uniref:Binuclear zinc transcription factor n=1 Tax=Triangularia verruculosa TaxID=2587418 RepID=A0AAN6XF98_9PEZI|nr:putative binuclear zinc transcription factor [Triangularia verruculosa]
MSTLTPSTSSPDGPSEPTTTPSGSGAGAGYEPLACVSCRTRKLKCDRRKPICTRCARSSGECHYPESRRKPAFKRRNVRELEERLAQVEGLLKNVSKRRASGEARTSASSTSQGPSQPPSLGPSQEPSPAGLEADSSHINLDDLFSDPSFQDPSSWFSQPAATEGFSATADSPPSWDLFGLGQFESLPPFQMIEDLHDSFFSIHYSFLPIIHKDKYLASFHRPPHMRPPMCLQYAIWTMASNGHPKYGCYHEALYRRARQYLEADELKGSGEHFISVSHAQAWALIAADEARRMLFTRAALSAARCVRIVGMMGLHRLDNTAIDEEHPIAPMIPPPKGWVELEERRRVFWGAFCIDSYAGISTGWPTLIDTTEVTTHLPASEDAFAKGQEEKSTALQSLFDGFNYSTYGGNVVICHIFNQIMKHAHCPMPSDRPDDFESGPFWQRHRELDTLLSSAFMFLPDRLRLPRNITNSVAVQTNMNLHAAIICLHNTSYEKAEKIDKLPASVKQDSRTRALMAAGEIVNILKLSHNMKTEYKSPLMALSLYCATSVYIAVAKDHQSQSPTSPTTSSASFMTSVHANLEFLLKSMESVSKIHYITRAYLNQILVDISRSGISLPFPLSSSLSSPESHPCHHGIPIVARTSSHKQTRLPVPFPGPNSGPRMMVPGVFASGFPGAKGGPPVFAGIHPGAGTSDGLSSGMLAGCAIQIFSEQPRGTATTTTSRQGEQQQPRQFVDAFHPCQSPYARGTDPRAAQERAERVMMFGFRGQREAGIGPQELPFRLGMHSGILGADFEAMGMGSATGSRDRRGDDALLHFSPGNVGGTTVAEASQGQSQGQDGDKEKAGEGEGGGEGNPMDIFDDLQGLGDDGDWGMMDPTDTFYSLLYNDGSGDNNNDSNNDNNNNNGGPDNNSGNMWSMNDFTGMWDAPR